MVHYIEVKMSAAWHSALSVPRSFPWMPPGGRKILWLRRHEPYVWANTEYVTTASSYLLYRVTGEKVIDRHTASHYMPLMDMDKLEWSDRFASELVDLEKLPRLAWSDETAGTVSREAGEATGLKPGTPVAAGAVDALSRTRRMGNCLREQRKSSPAQMVW